MGESDDDALARQRLAAQGEALNELREREMDLAHALKAARMGIWSWMLDDGSMRWSDEMGPLVGRAPGWKPSSMEEFMSLIHPDDLAMLQTMTAEVRETPTNNDVEYRVVHPDGSVRWVEVRTQLRTSRDGRPQMVGTFADITERRKLQDELLHAQKMEALGLFAGGIAHDFNNLLTVVLAQVGMLRDLHPDLRHVLDATQRAAGLTKQLLAFARKEEWNPTRLNVSELVRGMQPCWVDFSESARRWRRRSGAKPSAHESIGPSSSRCS